MGRRRVPWEHVFAFAVGAAVVSSLAWYQINSEYAGARAYWGARLSTIADDLAGVVSNYLYDRRADAEALAALPTFRAWLSPDRKTGQPELPHAPVHHDLTDFLDAFNAVYDYPGVYLLDPEGRILAQSTNSPELGPERGEICRTVAREGEFRFAPLSAGTGKSLLSFTAPVLAEAPRKMAESRPRHVVGAVTILSDSANSLFPLLAAESKTTPAVETVLLRREGNEAVFFSPLRHVLPSGASVRRSLVGGDFAGRAALEGRETSGEFIDYRGIRVFAATRQIKMSGWVLVSKIDRDDALAQFRRTARLEALVAGLVILAFGGFLIGHRRHQESRALRERIERQQAILNLQRNTQEIVDSVPAWLLVLSPDLRILSANRSFLESAHLSSRDVQGKPLDEVLRAEALPHRACEVLHGRVSSQDVLLDLSVGGHEEKRPARITIADLVRTEEGESQVLLVVEDLTESERLRVAAQASEQRLRELLESVDAIVWEADPITLQFSFVSHPAETILGYPVEQWLNEPNFWANRIHPEDRGPAVALRQQAVAQGTHHQLEYRVLAADGRVVWLRDSLHVVKDDSGRAQRLRGLMMDITERKRAEDALRKSEKRFRLLAQSLPGVVYLCRNDARYTMLYVSDSVERLTGYPKEDFLEDKVSFTDLYHPSDTAAVRREVDQSLEEHRPFHFSYRIRHRDGDWRWVDEISVAISEGGELLYWEGVLIDITDRRREEIQRELKNEDYRLRDHKSTAK